MIHAEPHAPSHPSRSRLRPLPPIATIIACATLILACGCSSHIKLKPLPVVYGPGRVDLCALIPESRRTPTVQVFYATNRAASGSLEYRQYSNAVDKNLHLGIATVQMGDDGTTWEQICKASSGKGGDPVFDIRKTSEVAESQEFFDAINQQLAVSPNHEVNVYVHGFKTDFAWELQVLAKLAHCSARRGAMVLFSWPSRQSLFVYGGDVQRGRNSAHHIADLLEQIALRTNADHINVLAYSAGAAAATDALLQLRDRLNDKKNAALAKRLHIGNIIYAASDIDLKTFTGEQLVKLKEIAQNIVIYISSNDAALGLASFGFGAERLGRPDTTKFTKEQQEEFAKDPHVQIVDVTDVPGPHSLPGGFGGHGYWYANASIMTDLLVTFRWQISPDQRGLYRKPGLARWFFPRDYPDRITAALLRLSLPTTQPTTSPAPD